MEDEQLAFHIPEGCEDSFSTRVSCSNVRMYQRILSTKERNTSRDCLYTRDDMTLGDRDRNWEKEMKKLKQANDTQWLEYKMELDEYKVELERLKKRLQRSDQDHTETLNCLRQELERKHKNEMGDMELKHHQQVNDLRRQMDAMNTTHTAEMNGLRTQVSNDQVAFMESVLAKLSAIKKEVRMITDGNGTRVHIQSVHIPRQSPAISEIKEDGKDDKGKGGKGNDENGDSNGSE